MNILSEFNRLYKLYGNNPDNTQTICEDISNHSKQDLEAILDYVHVFRYEEDAPSFYTWVKDYIPALDN